MDGDFELDFFHIGKVPVIYLKLYQVFCTCPFVHVFLDPYLR